MSVFWNRELMKKHKEKLIWLSLGLVVAAALAYLLRPAKPPIVLFSNQAAGEGAGSQSQNLTHAEKAAIIVKMAVSDEKFVAMKQLGSEWLSASPEEALEFRESILASPKLRQSFDQGAMPILSRLDPEQTLKVIDEGRWWPEQWVSERQALLKIAETNPEWVLERIGKIENPHERYQTFTALIVGGMAKSSPLEAVERADQFPEGPTKRRVYEQAMKEWVKKDPLSASEWLQKLPKSESRDGATDAFVNAIRFESPGDAFVWAASIGDDELRLENLNKVIQTWLGQGGFAAARKALTEAKLPEAERRVLLEQLPEAR